MLETIREYALEQLHASRRGANDPPGAISPGLAIAERGREGIRQADGVAWIGRLAADHDNFRAALTWSLADADRTSHGPAW